MTIEIKAEKRTKLGKLNSLRDEGFLPAVFYGHKKESTPIQIKKNDFIKAWKEAGESTVISLNIENSSIDALIHSVDIDPIKNIPLHADFYVFEKGHKVEVSIPLSFDGVAPAVKDFGGILIKSLHEIKVEAEPSKLPHEIKVDLSKLVSLDSQILAKDIELGNGVKLMENEDEVVASIAVAKEVVEETAPADLSSIEVEKKGKKEEEEAASQ